MSWLIVLPVLIPLATAAGLFVLDGMRQASQAQHVQDRKGIALWWMENRPSPTTISRCER